MDRWPLRGSRECRDGSQIKDWLAETASRFRSDVSDYCPFVARDCLLPMEAQRSTELPGVRGAGVLSRATGRTATSPSRGCHYRDVPDAGTQREALLAVGARETPSRRASVNPTEFTFQAFLNGLTALFLWRSTKDDILSYTLSTASDVPDMIASASCPHALANTKPLIN
jgi:hypothetical protein